MSLTCSVLGHKYGDRERVEERDRQGEEVVVTVREVKTCERCAETLVVSESKEVTAVHPEPAVVETDTDADAERRAEYEAEPDGSIESPPESGLGTAPEPAGHTGPGSTAAPSPGPTDALDADGHSPAEEDAEILEDSPPDRGPGEWPADPVEEGAADGTAAADANSGADEDDRSADHSRTSGDGDDESVAGGWPTVEGDDDGFDAAGAADAGATDPVIEAVAAQDDASASVGETTASGFVRASPIDAPAEPATMDVRSEYYCPQCSWSAPSLEASVRRGDICPECRTGYVAERDPK